MLWFWKIEKSWCTSQINILAKLSFISLFINSSIELYLPWSSSEVCYMKLVPTGMNTAIGKYIMKPEIVNLAGDIDGQVSDRQ